MAWFALTAEKRGNDFLGCLCGVVVVEMKTDFDWLSF